MVPGFLSLIVYLFTLFHTTFTYMGCEKYTHRDKKEKKKKMKFHHNLADYFGWNLFLVGLQRFSSS